MSKSNSVKITKALNNPGHHSTATLAVNVSQSNGEVYGTIHISDCFRKIELALDGSGAESLANVDYKVTTILNALTQVKQLIDLAFMERAFNLVEEKLEEAQDAVATVRG